jgi:AhpD family alkylhydroperoxidase
MSFRAFPSFDETTAATEAREPLARAKRAFGRIPAPLARYAGSPGMMLAALGALDSFEKSSLEPLEREVLAMTMASRNGCKLCLDHHRHLLRAQKAPAELISSLEEGAPLASSRLEALRAFVSSALEHHGDVPPAVWTNFREAGYGHAQALDVMLGISAYTLTTFANRLTETSE